MLKVSVVVPTYRSGDGLDRLVASLDAQTLPPDEFEVVFVDDGSPDDTYARLERIQATRPNVRLERIENSGWPCRPRNVGTDLARGEFVAYMDHDDTLYPDALRAAYEVAVANDADVVNGKEARTNDATWAIQTYRADAAQSMWRTDVNALIPMNPHKLYRRAFLDEHDIRFREGGRVMWEDIFFNLLVAKNARVISTMASVPYYHWVQTPGSGSKGFLRSSPDFWRWLREVFDATQTDLADDAFTVPREQLMAHQYRSRLLGSFDGRFAKRDEPERDLIYDACRQLQSDFALSAYDTELNASGRLRAHLLHAGERALLEALPQHDPGIPGWGAVSALRWVDGRLHVTAEAEWSSKAGRRHALRRDGERIVKALPSDILAAIPAGIADVTDEIAQATVEIGVRSRDARIVWMIPGAYGIDVDDAADGSVSFGGHVEAVIDPDTAVFGRPLDSGVWDVNVRCELGGSTQQASAVSDQPAQAIVFGDDLRVAYPTADGTLAFVRGPDARGLRHIAPVPEGVTAHAATDGVRVRIPLAGVEVQRVGAPDAAVDVAAAASGLAVLVERLRRRSPFRSTPARIVVDGDDVSLEVALPADSRGVRLRLGDGLPGAPRWWNLDITRAGAVRLRPGVVR